MAYPFLVTLADGILATLIREWQREPYRWSKELDFHVSLVSRIDTALRLLGRDTVLGNYGGAPAGFETTTTQRWARVAATPTVMLRGADKSPPTNVMPDVVVWDDIKDPNNPPDARAREVRRNWPMIWACELKLNDRKQTQRDAQKLSAFIQENELGYGSCVELTRAALRDGGANLPDGARAKWFDNLVYFESPLCKRLWHWKAWLPTIGEPSTKNAR